MGRYIRIRGKGFIQAIKDDHIFEKTLKIELSPIPQAYPLKS
jgi:hypothetical protein